MAFCLNSFSQNFPPTGSSNYDVNLNKFEGTWKWSDNVGNEFTIKIKKAMQHYEMNGGFDDEALFLCWKYVKNNVIIEDNLSLFPTLGQSNVSSPILSLLNPNTLRGLMKDNLLNKLENIRLIYSNNSSTQTLAWKLHNITKTYMPGVTPVPDFNTTLPKDLVLIKQP